MKPPGREEARVGKQDGDQGVCASLFGAGWRDAQDSLPGGAGRGGIGTRLLESADELCRVRFHAPRMHVSLLQPGTL